MKNLMSGESVERDENNALPCKKCKRNNVISYPYVVKASGLCYARCPTCRYYDVYEFLGTRDEGAINSWNIIMGKKT